MRTHAHAGGATAACCRPAIRHAPGCPLREPGATGLDTIETTAGSSAPAGCWLRAPGLGCSPRSAGVARPGAAVAAPAVGGRPLRGSPRRAPGAGGPRCLGSGRPGRPLPGVAGLSRPRGGVPWPPWSCPRRGAARPRRVARGRLGGPGAVGPAGSFLPAPRAPLCSRPAPRRGAPAPGGGLGRAPPRGPGLPLRPCCWSVRPRAGGPRPPLAPRSGGACCFGRLCRRLCVSGPGREVLFFVAPAGAGFSPPGLCPGGVVCSPGAYFPGRGSCTVV